MTPWRERVPATYHRRLEAAVDSVNQRHPDDPLTDDDVVIAYEAYRENTPEGRRHAAVYRQVLAWRLLNRANPQGQT